MKYLFLAVFLVFISTRTAFAYIDPGTGSLIVSSVLGALAAFTYTFRNFIQKFKDFLFSSKKNATRAKTKN